MCVRAMIPGRHRWPLADQFLEETAEIAVAFKKCGKTGDKKINILVLIYLQPYPLKKAFEGDT